MRKLAPVKVLLFCLLAAAFLFRQNNALKTEELLLSLPQLPEAFEGFRLVQLSDLHGHCFGEEQRGLIRALRRAEPDAICITGDLFDEDHPPQELYAFLRTLTELAPTFYVTGNHEWQYKDLPAILEEMEALGVQVLGNDYAVLRRQDQKIFIAGVHDPCGPYDQMTPPELLEQLYFKESSDAFVILLAHRNHILQQWPHTDARLILSGHSHGGIVRLPIVGGLFGSGGSLFPKFDAGLYPTDDGFLFVSRGLGNSGLSLRLFNRPQLPVLVLQGEKIKIS